MLLPHLLRVGYWCFAPLPCGAAVLSPFFIFGWCDLLLLLVSGAASPPLSWGSDAAFPSLGRDATFLSLLWVVLLPRPPPFGRWCFLPLVLWAVECAPPPVPWCAVVFSPSIFLKWCCVLLFSFGVAVLALFFHTCIIMILVVVFLKNLFVEMGICNTIEERGTGTTQQVKAVGEAPPKGRKSDRPNGGEESSTTTGGSPSCGVVVFSRPHLFGGAVSSLSPFGCFFQRSSATQRRKRGHPQSVEERSTSLRGAAIPCSFGVVLSGWCCGVASSPPPVGWWCFPSSPFLGEGLPHLGWWRFHPPLLLEW